jgi:hypothetical protein
MQLLVKFPSRSRPTKFFDALDNIFELSTHDDIRIMATLDLDDSNMTSQEVKDKIKTYDRVHAIWGTSESKIHACNKDMEFSGRWDIAILMSDDQKFLVKGFDSIIVEKMKEHWPDTDGVLHFPDSHGKHELSVLSILGRKYFNRFGWFYFPGYKTMFCDNEYTQTAQILNRWAFVPMKIYDHYHHIWGMAQKDDLNLKNDNMNLYVGDSQLFQQRKANNFGLYTL